MRGRGVEVSETLFYTGSCKEHFTYEKKEGYWLIVLLFWDYKDNFM